MKLNILSLINKTIANDEMLSRARDASFKDFHCKGLQYICLFRSPGYTLKFYFMEDEARSAGEVVCPHDHRYMFRTKVLSGRLINYTFCPTPHGETYNAFDFKTPLNGGDGFSFRGEECLERDSGSILSPGNTLTSTPQAIHTIRSIASDTVLMLEQFHDTVPIDTPTSTWSAKGEPTPKTDGLYSKFEGDELVGYLHKLARMKDI